MKENLLVPKSLKHLLSQACSQGLPIAKYPPLQFIVYFHNNFVIKTKLTVAPVFTCLFLGPASHKAMEEIILWGSQYAQKCPPQIPSYIDKTLISEKHYRILNALTMIPFGEKRTYSEIATQIKSHPRAIGIACKHNPFLLFFPCHRVLGSRGEQHYIAGQQIHNVLLNFETKKDS
ncbi:MGMT family protein [Chlamydia sp. 17-3921]|uniref:MGMT family protein n=1 Tax=Chlamydia sp. 17-3921 TaxID=2675798 RepID=UPI0019196ED0|nr:methylated-DNA--[protein]-cysteine S-methyltransferase [Chlamydia sp. 17-3921]